MTHSSGNTSVRLGTLVIAAAILAGPVAAQEVHVGAFPHFAAGGGWQTTFRLHNTGTSPARVSLDFFGDDGAAQKVPVVFIQSSIAGYTAGSVSATLSAGQEWIVRTNAESSKPAASGWAMLSADGSVTGFAVFSLNAGASLNEAVVPLETRNPARFTVAFENKDRYSTGIAIANTVGLPAAISVTIRNDAGTTIATATVYLPSFGHKAMLVPNEWPAAADQRGTIEFSTPANGQIAVLGLSFNPTLNFSSIPAESSGAAVGSSSAGPEISGITPVAAQQAQTITITGSGFGTHAAYIGNSSFIEIVNSSTSGWGAGFLNSDINSPVTLSVASWTDSKIVLNGFAGAFGQTGKTIRSGDPLQVRIWNAQSMKGPAFYSLTAVGGGSNTTPLTIVTSGLQNGVVGASYYVSISDTGGAIGAQTWRLTSGSSLPPGLTFKDGIISGTPSDAGTFVFGVQVVDAAGASASRTFTLTITAPPSSGGGGSSVSGGGGSGGSGSVYTGGGTVITPTLSSNCVTNFYDPTNYNWWVSTNNCGVDIDIIGVWQVARSGSYSIGESGIVNPGKSTRWGYSKSEVAARGGWVLFVCPGGYRAVDSTGKSSLTPTSTYWCRKS